jgi:serine protease Do
LIADGRVHRGMLGVTVQPVTADLARSLGLPSTRGALVSSVTDDGPAEQAGVKRGDVITSVNGAPVQNSNDVRNRIAATKPGSTVALVVTRNGREQELKAKVAELPSQGRAPRAVAGEEEGGKLGLALAPLPAERSRELGLDPGEGLVVSNVSSGSPAEDAGFQRGDVILEVNGTVPRSPEDVRKAVPATGDAPALVLVRRGEQPLYLPLSPRL